MAVKPQQAPYREAAFTRRSSRKHFKSDTTWKLSCASRRASFSLLIYSFVYYGHTFARCNIFIRMIICTRNVCVGIHKFNQSHKCHIYKKKGSYIVFWQHRYETAYGDIEWILYFIYIYLINAYLCNCLDETYLFKAIGVQNRLIDRYYYCL